MISLMAEVHFARPPQCTIANAQDDVDRDITAKERTLFTIHGTHVGFKQQADKYTLNERIAILLHQGNKATVPEYLRCLKPRSVVRHLFKRILFDKTA
jgi:hypothetical protein